LRQRIHDRIPVPGCYTGTLRDLQSALTIDRKAVESQFDMTIHTGENSKEAVAERVAEAVMRLRSQG